MKSQRVKSLTRTERRLIHSFPLASRTIRIHSDTAATLMSLPLSESANQMNWLARTMAISTGAIHFTIKAMRPNT